MDDRTYSDAELERYFSSPQARRAQPAHTGNGEVGNGADGNGARGAAPPPSPIARPALPSGDGGVGPTARPAAPPPRFVPPPAPPSEDDEVRRRTNSLFRAVLLAGAALGGLVLLFLLWLARDLPSLEQIENPRNLLSTVVYTADGAELARYYAGENRTWVPLDSISPSVIQALIATEDREFYDHWGVHLRRTLQAPFTVLTGRTQGGSTITQQLARNLYREQVGFDRSVTRKLKEMLTAVRIERTYTKEEVLEAYLNTVPWGYSAYGIESAAETYFSKTAYALAPEEAAVLVGMLAATTRYNPLRNPNDSRTRRNVVLANMAHEGFLSEEDFGRLRAAPIRLQFKRYSHTDNLAPHFAEALRLWFRDWAEKNGYDPYADGLVIRTTIDSRLQRLAQEAVDAEGPGLQAVVDYEWSGGGGLGSTTEPYLRRMQRGDVEPFRLWWSRNRRVVDEYVTTTPQFTALQSEGLSREDAILRLREEEAFMDSLRTAKTRLEAGLIALEPRTGRIRAWVGGRDFIADKYDHVGQARRQPGSTFKAFAYTAALEEGFSPSTPILDAPFTWGDWRPQNSGGGYSGYMPLRQALAHSKNVVAARLTRELTPRTVEQYAHRMGIRSPLEPVRSIALGTNDVSLLEMSVGYATIASGGVYHGPPMMGDGQPNHDIPPHIELAVDRIEDRYGNVVAEFDYGGREVLNRSRAFDMVDMMRGTLDFGTARGFRGRYDVGEIDLAGKTGTTQESADGWFIAMHPDLVVGSWVGFNDRRITFRSSYWGQGGHSALLYVGNFLERLQNEGPAAVRLDPEREFEKPENYEEPGHRRATYRGGDYPLVNRRRRSAGGGGSGPGAVEGDRPARDLLDRWRERESGGASPSAPAPAPAPPPPAPEPAPADRGRVGW